MRTAVFAAAALAASALATPAFAQDVDPTFTGPRIGALAGFDAVKAGSSEDSDIQGDDQSAEGFLYGLDVGYDVAVGRLIVGVEGELTDSTGKVDNDYSDPNYYGFGRVKTGRDLYIGARIGTKVAPKTIAYVKGGYTNQRLNVLAANGTYEQDDHFNLDGWRVGAGVEQALGRNAYAKLEYRYSNYTNADYTFTDGSTSSNFDIDTDRHQVVVGVGFRF